MVEPTFDMVLILGIVNAILTELIKIIPAIDKTDERKGLTAFIVAFFVSMFYLMSIGSLTTDTLIKTLALSLGVSFVAFKTFVKPVVNPITRGLLRAFGGSKAPQG